MSFFKHWQFRSATPELTPGESYTATVTDYSEKKNQAHIRIGDTLIKLTNIEDPIRLLDRKVDFRIDEFNDDHYKGKGTLLEVYDQANF